MENEKEESEVGEEDEEYNDQSEDGDEQTHQKFLEDIAQFSQKPIKKQKLQTIEPSVAESVFNVTSSSFMLVCSNFTESTLNVKHLLGTLKGNQHFEFVSLINLLIGSGN